LLGQQFLEHRFVVLACPDVAEIDLLHVLGLVFVLPLSALLGLRRRAAGLGI